MAIKMKLRLSSYLPTKLLSSIMSHHFFDVVLPEFLLFHLPTGVFITKGDVGVGTIVGSAVFNILVIIGLSGIFAGQVEQTSTSKYK